MAWGYRRMKTEAGACTPGSQDARWMPRAEAKQASKRRRRRQDKRAVQSDG